MQINCTVIIQAINFFITYLFLRKFFLRPTTKLVQQKETAKKIMAEKLKLKELHVKNLTIKKINDLEDFRQSIRQRYKKPEPMIPKIDSDVLGKERVVVTQETISECKNIIVKELSNAL